MLIYMNGIFADESRIAVDPLAQGFLYGCGVYETVKIFDGRPVFLGEHIERMAGSLGVFNLELNIGAEMAQEICAELISANNIDSGFFKLICSRNGKGGSDVIAYVGKRSYDGRYEKGFSLCMADSVRNESSVLCGIKSLNHGENIIELERAEKAGYDESVFMNTKGMVCEGSRSNIFWSKGDIVHTPSLSCGLLPGVTRAKILTLCREAGIRTMEGEYGLPEMRKADGIFLTSAIMGIMPVRSFMDSRYETGFCTTAEKLMRLYSERYLNG